MVVSNSDMRDMRYYRNGVFAAFFLPRSTADVSHHACDFHNILLNSDQPLWVYGGVGS